MLKNKSCIIKGVLIVILLLFAVHSAMAQLTIKNPKVVDLSGAGVGGTPITIIYGASIATPSPAASPYYSGTIYKTYTTGGGGVATFTDTDSNLDTSIYMKAWKGAAGPNGFYGFYGPESTSNSTDLRRWDDKVITTNYKADKPYLPVITQFEETSTTKTDGSKTSKVKVYSSQSATPDNSIREVSGISWKKGDSASTMSDTPGSGAILELSSSEAVPGQTYYFSVTYANAWGSDTSPAVSYTIGKGGGGGPETDVYTFQYVQLSSGPMGINTFTFPFTSTASPAAVATMKDLAYAIISQNDPGNAIPAVSTIGMWFPDKMWPVGYTITKTGAGTTPADFTFAGGADLKAGGDEPLVKDRAYQISVTRPCTFTITGTR